MKRWSANNPHFFAEAPLRPHKIEFGQLLVREGLLDLHIFFQGTTMKNTKIQGFMNIKWQISKICCTTVNYRKATSNKMELQNTQSMKIVYFLRFFFENRTKRNKIVISVSKKHTTYKLNCFVWQNPKQYQNIGTFN